MKRVSYLICIVAGACLVSACAKSVERAQQDVRRAQNQAVDNVRQEQKELRETQQEAGERVARQERRVEDAARRGNEEILDERRELEDAKRAEARREINDTTDAPRINDRSATIDNRPPARVNVDVNRGPDGVNVDVNRNP